MVFIMMDDEEFKRMTKAVKDTSMFLSVAQMAAGDLPHPFGHVTKEICWVNKKLGEYCVEECEAND